MQKKILIAEDDVNVQKLLVHILSKQGFMVETAKDGLETLNKAREIKPDVILLDVMMAKINGFEVCRLLKFDERYKNIPIVILTCLSSDEDKDVGREIKADRYLTKPFSAMEVLKVINEVLNKRE